MLSQAEQQLIDDGHERLGRRVRRARHMVLMAADLIERQPNGDWRERATKRLRYLAEEDE